jgi:alpha-galactosidase
MEDILKQLTIRAETSTDIPGGMLLSGKRVTLELPGPALRYHYSGWQSWSLTTWLETSRRLGTPRPSILHPMQHDPLNVHDDRPNGSWYGALELASGGIVFLGALGLDAHVAMGPCSINAWFEPARKEGIACEWFLAAGNEDDIFAQYASMLGDRLGRGHFQKPYRVWCSWYSLNTQINEQQLLKILSDLDDLPFDVFQVDDGWQVGIGDWEPNGKFPSGMDSLAAKIKSTGRKAGLWLAPLLVVPSSSVYRQHPDWLLHDKKGRLVSAGFNWGERLYALDTTHPQALDWQAAQMKKVHQWGYDYLKLDFLYAGALPGKRHTGMPREAAYRNGLQVIRAALGDAYLLTCGAPVLPSIGLCDGLRVGPDVAGQFSSTRDDNLLRNYATPGVRNALRTSLNRLWLAPLLHTDPDVVYFRSRECALTDDQKSLLQDLAAICNFKASSDIPYWLTVSERNALRAYLESSPPIQKIGQAAYRIGGRTVDFSAYIGMPPVPGVFTNLAGAILAGLANVPALMRIFDELGNASVKKILKDNPV